jgi:hypothetical protein
VWLRRNKFGKLIEVTPDDAGDYRTLLLPDFILNVPILWQEDLPDIFAITERVRAMLQA